MADYTQRFTSRADNYAKYRPSYARGVLDLLREECGLVPGWVIADIGSGTGISTAMFLDHGCRVYAVEPNNAMRAYAEQTLGGNPRFNSIAAQAEATTLPDATVDLVAAGQAFHWLEPDATRVEWARILKPGGWVALMWNSRQDDASPFARGYEALLEQYSLDYQQVHHRNVGSAALDAFFGAGRWRRATFDNPQTRDWEALSGGLQSGSYTPEPGHPNHAPLMEGMRQLFEEHEVDGYVVLPTATEVYYGQLSS